MFPAYYVRHRVGHAHEKSRIGVFMMVQQFFDCERVISAVGCQKIDVVALGEGKALVHLELIETFKTLMTAFQEAEACARCSDW